MSLPPVEIPLGAMRFNSDSQKLEYFNGQIWMQVHTFSPNLDGGTRVLNMGGYAPAYADNIEYVTVETAGNATVFGDLTYARHLHTGFSSNTRACSAGGSGPDAANDDRIDYVTFSSTGDAIDFGNLTVKRYGSASGGNQTRGVIATGYYNTPSATEHNTIDYVTIASTGNAVDFGDTVVKRYAPLMASSPTRLVVGGGTSPTPGSTVVGTLDYIVTTTTGNAQDFGDLSNPMYYTHGQGNSSATRGLFGGGYQPATPTKSSNYDYLTFSTLGNSVNFGDLAYARFSACTGGSRIRGLWLGGRTPTLQNYIDYVSIQTGGQAIDFGDKQTTFAYGTAASNGHGGLG